MLLLLIILCFQEELAFMYHGVGSYDKCTLGRLKSKNMALELPCCSGCSRTSGLRHAFEFLLLPSKQAGPCNPTDSVISLCSPEEQG